MLSKRIWLLPLWALLFAGAVPAWAHGRFPEAGSVIVDPQEAQHLLVRTTYGIVSTIDGGQNWHWTCGEAVGFDADKEDPAVLITDSGSIIAGTFDGLSVSHEGGCDWAYSEDVPPNRYFIDVQADGDLSGVMALASNGIGTDLFDVMLWASSNGGQSWAQVGVAPPSDFLAVTVGVPPSDTNRIYISGRDGNFPDTEGVIFRSDDRGANWTRMPVPGTDDGKSLPYVAAVVPDDPDTLFVAVFRKDDGVIVHFSLMVSHDGAASWETVFERPNAMTGFALSPDASQVALAGADDGLWIAPYDTLAFTQKSTLHISCLNWSTSGLYACADQFVDGYTLGVSADEGQSFSPLMELSSPCGALSCPAGSSVGEACPGRWPKEKAELNAQDCGDGADEASAGSGDAAGCRLGPATELRGLGWPGWVAIFLAAAAAFRRWWH